MNHRTCPQCQTEIWDDLPGGMCPACLMAAAKKPVLDRGATVTEAPQNQPPAQPPSLEKMARIFPELEIVRIIGRGGMGAVYEARQKNLDRSVAVKVFLPRAEQDDLTNFGERFTREARALARLNHQNIVSIFDTGVRYDSQEAGGSDSEPIHFFIMELVDGLNLREISHRERLSPNHAIQLVPQLCTALQYAHDRGVIHRDIKPENILIDSDGIVKIADFGLAKLSGPDDGLTRTQQVMGTYNYMAPEQFEQPMAVDHRADIYSLGVVIYELLTGELPRGRFQPPSEKAKFDARLDEVVMRALEKEPGRRYQQISEFGSGVETFSNANQKGTNTTGNKAQVNVANQGPSPSTFQKAAPHHPAPPQPPVKPAGGTQHLPYVQTEYVEDSTTKNLILLGFKTFGLMMCMSCAIVFILGSSDVKLIPEDASHVLGVMVAMAGGFLLVCTYYLRFLLGLPDPEWSKKELREFHETSPLIVWLRLIGTALGFTTAVFFIWSNKLGDVIELDRDAAKYWESLLVTLGVVSAITTGFFFAFSGMVEQMFCKK